jgi:hypothetical protein
MTQTALFLPEFDSPIEQQVFESDTPWGCDWGSGYFHIWREGKYKKLKPDQFATLNFANAGDVVVIENAHMQARTGKSLAQIYNIEQLIQIKETATAKNVDIRLWFHSQTPKWRAILSMGDKSDETDAETVARIAAIRGVEDLQYFNPRASYPPRIKWAHEQIEEMNTILNVARIDYMSAMCPTVDMFNKIARNKLLHTVWKLYHHHSEITRDITKWFFGINSFRQGISLWAAITDWDGNPRAYNGNQPGVKFIMNELLRMKPNHFRGGVARSNLMHHGFRNEVIAHMGTRKNGKKGSIKKLAEFTQIDNQKWLAYRQQYRKAMVHTLHAMKHYVNQ